MAAKWRQTPADQGSHGVTIIQRARVRRSGVVFTLLASLGADVVINRLCSSHGPLIVIGLLLLDLSSTSIQPLGRADLGAIDAGAALAAGWQRATWIARAPCAPISSPFFAICGSAELSPKTAPEWACRRSGPHVGNTGCEIRNRRARGHSDGLRKIQCRINPPVIVLDQQPTFSC
jgi:hypothetical protein